MTAPAWTRLDNASLIYPACRTRRYATTFRIAATLDEDISPYILAQALVKTSKRFPSMRYGLDKGFFWWILRRLENDPALSTDIPMKPFSFRKNGGYMFRVGYNENRIILDVFHVLTDGNGGMTFLLSLTAEYLRMRYGIDIPATPWVLNPEEEPAREELEDSFDRFSGVKGELDKETRAYHVLGTPERHDVLNNMKISFSSDEVKAKAGELGCTVTELLTAVMLKSLQEVRREQNPRGIADIKVEVPVNLRPIFSSRTLRNFSSYVHLGIDVRNGEIPFAEILEEVKLQKKLFANPRRLTTRVAGNVALEDNLAIRSIPLFIKKPVINFINTHKGDNYCSQTLSNIGNISLPEPMRPHVRDIDFILGRSVKRSGACACLSYGGRLNLNFSRRIAEHDFEDRFIENMRSLGLDSCVKSYRPSEEYCIPKPNAFNAQRRQLAKMHLLRRLLLV